MLVCPYHIADTPMFGDDLFGEISSTQLARYSLPLRCALRVLPCLPLSSSFLPLLFSPSLARIGIMLSEYERHSNVLKPTSEIARKHMITIIILQIEYTAGLCPLILTAVTALYIHWYCWL